ncbi:MAG: UDP-N-acetylglucosamine 2-epimerase [Flavobacteriales bacterium]
MGRSRINIAILTSSRADYGIWLPLLKQLRNDTILKFELIAFGTHLSKNHGYTIKEIISDGFDVSHQLDTMPHGDAPSDISHAMGKTMMVFSEFWRVNGAHFDIVLCLGDRYEMFAAVVATAPFGLLVAHVHGGETTLGAIDNAFRHSISQFSRFHFVSSEHYSDRIRNMVDHTDHVYVVGALGLDNVRDLNLLDATGFEQRFGIRIDENTILFTFHPETMMADNNVKHGQELVRTLLALTNYNVLVTMPNADTYGDTLRSIFLEGLKSCPRIQMVENLGSLGYLSAMNLCAFLMGNTSSGIIEAASFGKYVINLGSRQQGRACGDNVMHVEVDKQEILSAVHLIESKGEWQKGNMYDKGGAANCIIDVLKSHL